MVESGNTMGAQKVILKELETQFGGSAEAAGGTLAGQLNVARETFNNLAGSIVGAVLPAFTGFAGVLNTVLGWLSAHQTTTKVLIGILATLAAGVLAVNAITKVYAATQAVLNVVLAANPIGLVILLIAGLVAGLILAYKNSETFRNIVRGAMEVVKTAVNAVVEAVKDVVSAVVAAKDHPAVKAIQTVFTTYFGAAKTAVSGLINTVEAIIGAVRAVVNSDAVGNIKGAFERGFGAAKAAVDAVADAAGNVIAVVGEASRAVDNLMSKIASIKGPSGVDLIKKIPGLAHGGVVSSPTLAMVGEAGPEVVIPLSRPERARQLMAATGLGGGGSGVTVQNMNVYEREDVYRVASQLGRQLSMAR